MVLYILGATAGLASETLQQQAEAGHSLVLHGRNEEKLKSLQASLQDKTEVSFVVGEVEEVDLMDRMWQAGQKLAGSPGHFLCFVGIPGRLAPKDWSPSSLASVFATNCSGPLLACRRWAQLMMLEGLQANAVLLSTMQAQYPFEGSLPYSLGKVALEHGLRLLAKEYAPALRINGIAPGVNEAGMALASIQRGKYQPYVDSGVIPRFGQPSDLAHAVNFLLQDELYMTGETLLLDGGFTLRRDQHRL